ncbi:MAG: RNA 2',3'-cyclic phosphodiesterase [Gemmatimonadales bacterium]
MRLFIAVPLPPGAEAETAEVLRHLRSLDWPVRWIRPEGIHVTLKFFGETSTDRVEAIAEAVDYAVRDTRPITMSLHGAGVFPNTDKPRVIHLGIDADSGLELLQDRLERSTEHLGFPPEGRMFRPHVTLGRVREGHRLPAGWQTELERIPPGEAFLADRVVLFESELTPEGPRYSIRHQVKLG